MNVLPIIPLTQMIVDIRPVDIHKIILNLEGNPQTLTILYHFGNDIGMESQEMAHQLGNESRQDSCFEVSHLQILLLSGDKSLC